MEGDAAEGDAVEGDGEEGNGEGGAADDNESGGSGVGSDESADGELDNGELDNGESGDGESAGPAGEGAASPDGDGPIDPAPGTTPGRHVRIGPGDAGGRNGTSIVWVEPFESSFDPAVIAASVGTDASPTRSATMSTYRRVGPENPLSAR